MVLMCVNLQAVRLWDIFESDADIWALGITVLKLFLGQLPMVPELKQSSREQRIGRMPSAARNCHPCRKT
jgi:hypothetical protein